MESMRNNLSQCGKYITLPFDLLNQFDENLDYYELETTELEGYQNKMTQMGGKTKPVDIEECSSYPNETNQVYE